jgi:hypothetical protein
MNHLGNLHSINQAQFSQLHLRRVLAAGLSTHGKEKGSKLSQIISLTSCRIYLSLTGKKLTGSAAMKQAREDHYNMGHPSRIARSGLREVSC